MDGRDLVNTVVAFGCYTVAVMCIYLGCQLFVAGATGGFKFAGNVVGLESVVPGLALIVFGMFLAVFALHKLVDIPRQYALVRGVRSWGPMEPRGRRGWHSPRRG